MPPEAALVRPAILTTLLVALVRERPVDAVARSVSATIPPLLCVIACPMLTSSTSWPAAEMLPARSRFEKVAKRMPPLMLLVSPVMVPMALPAWPKAMPVAAFAKKLPAAIGPPWLIAPVSEVSESALMV